MPPKSSENLIRAGWMIGAKQKIIIDEEAFSRRYVSTSELVREIFQAWIDENHKR